MISKAYLNGRILLKKINEDCFHLYNLDTKDEARINNDLKEIFLLSSKKTPLEISKALSQKLNIKSEYISRVVNDSIEKLIKWGFLSKNKKKTSNFSYVEKKGLLYQVDHIYLEITKLCNLSCIHCYNESEPNQKLTKDEMSSDVLSNTIDKVCNEFGPLLFTITGGEPFIRKDIFDVVKQIYLKNVDFSIFTNGTLLNKEKIEELKDYNPKFIAVSLDGIDNKTHSIIRGNNSFYKVVENIKTLVSEGINIRVNTTLLKGVNDNRDDIMDMLYFFNDLGVTSLGICGLNDAGRGKNLREYFVSEKIAGILRDCFENFKQNSLEDITPIGSLSALQTYDLKDSFCGLGVSSFMVMSNGDITLCPLLTEREHKAGSILYDNIIDLWNNSSVFNYLRNNPFNIDGECKICDVSEVCRGGCRASVYEKEKSFIGPDKWFCNFYGKT